MAPRRKSKIARGARGARRMRGKAPSLNKVKRAVRKASRPLSSDDVGRAVAAREKLVDAAAKLLAEAGFRAINMPRAAKRAGVSLAVARSLFRTSLHLVAATLEQQLEEDLEVTESEIISVMHARHDPALAIRQMLAAQLRRHAAGGWWRLYLDMDLLATSDDSRDILRQLQARLRERALSFIAALQGRGLIHDGHDAEAVWFLWSALLDGAVLRARVSSEPTDIDSLAAMLAPVLAQGLRAPKA